MPILTLALINLAIVCFIMLLAWIWSRKLNNYSIVDAFWSLNFAVIAVVTFFLSDGYPPRRIIVCALMTLWSLRLGAHLAGRIFSHIHEEEGRYKQLRAEWKPSTFFFFFQAQGISNALLCIPLFIMCHNKAPFLYPGEQIGHLLWLVSIIGEGISDWQLQKFKEDPANKGKVCDVGLWHYSRHPNYFFQLMIQVSIFIAAIPSPYGWISVICPLTIGYLLFRVTGIPMTEEQSLRSRGDLYREYQRTTSEFIPWFKKK